MKTMMLKCKVSSKILFGVDKDGNALTKELPYRVVNWPETLEEACEVFDDAETFLERSLSYADAHGTKGTARTFWSDLTAKYEAAYENWFEEHNDVELNLQEVLDWCALSPEERKKAKKVHSKPTKEAYSAIIAGFAAELGALPQGPELSFSTGLRLSNEVQEQANTAVKVLFARGEATYQKTLASCEERGYVRLRKLFPTLPAEGDARFTTEVARAIAHKLKWEKQQKELDALNVL